MVEDAGARKIGDADARHAVERRRRDAVLPGKGGRRGAKRVGVPLLLRELEVHRR